MTFRDVLLNQDARCIIETGGVISIKNLIFNQEVQFYRYDAVSFFRYVNLPVLNYIPMSYKHEILILTTVDLTIY